jgi:hypothetical protein
MLIVHTVFLKTLANAVSCFVTSSLPILPTIARIPASCPRRIIIMFHMCSMQYFINIYVCIFFTKCFNYAEVITLSSCQMRTRTPNINTNVITPDDVIICLDDNIKVTIWLDDNINKNI